MSVDIFGQSADMTALLALAQKYGLKVISDTAQAPGARYFDRYAGTLADVGGFSLNYHKHIHCGEGGILVTDDDALAERLRLIRNHAEAVVGPMGYTNLSNMVGHNFRLGEIECAIASEQLKKLGGLIEGRQRAAKRLSHGLTGLPGLGLPFVSEGCTHVYYVYPLTVDTEMLGLSKETIVRALSAEGVPGMATQYQNIHLLPIYQQKIAFGSQGFPWSAGFCKREVDYRKGICPVAEDLQDRSYMGYAMCMNEMGSDDCKRLIEAFERVWHNLDSLREYEARPCN
jgi:perosamine synthetase